MGRAATGGALALAQLYWFAQWTCAWAVPLQSHSLALFALHLRIHPRITSLAVLLGSLLQPPFPEPPLSGPLLMVLWHSHPFLQRAPPPAAWEETWGLHYLHILQADV